MGKDRFVYELNTKQVQNWCKKYLLQPVEEMYYGYTKDLYPTLDINNEDLWREHFLETFKKIKLLR